MAAASRSRLRYWVPCLLLLLPVAFRLPPPTTEAASVPVAPPNGSFVFDGAQVLSDSAVHRLNQRLSAVNQSGVAQIAVYITDSLSGFSPEAFSLRVAEEWGIGKAGVDNGLLFFVAPNDRRVRLEVGLGPEPFLPDIVCNHILRQTVLPEFKRNRWEAGISNGISALLPYLNAFAAEQGLEGFQNAEGAALRPEGAVPDSDEAWQLSEEEDADKDEAAPKGSLLGILFSLFAALLPVLLFAGMAARGGLPLVWWLGSFGGGRGFGGGFGGRGFGGGFSGGGGSFGGGGASGSW